MSNTSSHKAAFSYERIPSRDLSSSKSYLADSPLPELNRRAADLSKNFNWRGKPRLEESPELVTLVDAKEQMNRQNEFTRKNITIIGAQTGRGSRSGSMSKYGNHSEGASRYGLDAPAAKMKGFLKESPQMLDYSDHDHDADEDSDLEFKPDEKVTESTERTHRNHDHDSSHSAVAQGFLQTTTEVLRNVYQSRFFQTVVATIIIMIPVYVLSIYAINTANYARYGDPRANRYASYIPVDSLTEVNSKLRQFQVAIEELTDRQESFFSDNNVLANHLEELQASFNKNWDQLNRKHTKLNSQVQTEFSNSGKFEKDFTNLIQRLKAAEEGLKRTKDLDVDQSRQLSELFAHVSRLESDLEAANVHIDDLLSFKAKFDEVFDNLEEDVLESVMTRLPSMIPIIRSEQGQIQMFPEVYDYLSEVIRNTVKIQLNSIDLAAQAPQSDLSWDAFLQRNGIEFDQYMSQFITDELKLVKKQDFEHILIENVKANREKLDRELAKIRKAVDQQIGELDSKISRILHTSSDASSATSDILIGHLIDKKIDENTLKIEGRANYADVDQGARIIQPLTSNFIENYLTKRQNILQSTVFRAFHFVSRFTAGSKVSPSSASISDAIANPNNALSDDNSYWLALKDDCHIGIKLYKEILLVELLIKHPRNDNPLVLTSAPKKISVYVKPTTQEHRSILTTVFDKYYDQDFVPSLAAFVKVTEFEYDIKNPHIYQFIQLPKEYLQLNIPVQEIYLDVESNWGHDQITSLHNVKAFGINQADIKNAKKFLHLDEDASTEDVIDEIRDKFVNGATYAIHQDLDSLL